MSAQFLLNLANRSAGKSTASPVRPYLHPVFMPPAPFPAAGTSPPRPAPQQPVRTASEPPSIYSRVASGQQTADLPQRGRTPQFMPSSFIPRPIPDRPLETGRTKPLQAEAPPVSASTAETDRAISPKAKPSPVPASMTITEQAMPLPAERPPVSAAPKAETEPTKTAATGARPDPQDGTRRSGRKPVRTSQLQNPAKTMISPDHPVEPAPSSQPLPSAHPEVQKNDKSRKQSLLAPVVTDGHPITEGKDGLSPVRPVTPPFSVPNRQETHWASAVFERIVTLEPRQPKPPQMRQDADLEPQTAPPRADLSAPAAEKIIRESVADPDVRQTSNNRKSGEETPIKMERLPLTTIIARSTDAETPLSAAAPELPVTPAPVRAGRVTPAPEQRPVLQPQPVHADNTPPVQVRIGTIDLRVTPSETAGIQSSYQRKRPQGFDSFQQRRSYLGWEE